MEKEMKKIITREIGCSQSYTTHTWFRDTRKGRDIRKGRDTTHTWFRDTIKGRDTRKAWLHNSHLIQRKGRDIRILTEEPCLSITDSYRSHSYK